MSRLAAVAGEQEFAAGQFIVRQGQVGSGLYVVIDGSVNVIKGADEQIANLKPGDFFGELSVIDQQPRNASVQARKRRRVWPWRRGTSSRCLSRIRHFHSI